MANAYMHVIIHAVDGMSASSYNGINGQALYMYVIMWTCRHVGVTADIIASWASAHWCIDADMPSGCQAIQCTNIFCISFKVYFRHYINGHVSTCQCTDTPNVSCADFITSLLLGWLHHRADALTC